MIGKKHLNILGRRRFLEGQPCRCRPLDAVNTDLPEALELDNMIAQASVSLHSAIGRTESRGAHAREDFPKRDDENWLKHTLSWLDHDGRVRLDYRPVRLQPPTNEVATIPPKDWVY